MIKLCLQEVKATIVTQRTKLTVYHHLQKINYIVLLKDISDPLPRSPTNEKLPI